MTPKPKNQSENEKVWAIVESAMTALSDGDKKEEPVAALAQAFEQANANMHVRAPCAFVDVACLFLITPPRLTVWRRACNPMAFI